MNHHELMDAIRAERAKLPAVDHNGRPLPTDPPPEPAEPPTEPLAPPPGPRNPIPDPSQGGGRALPAPSLDQQIADAQRSGDTLGAFRLQRSKLNQLRRSNPNPYDAA